MLYLICYDHERYAFGVDSPTQLVYCQSDGSTLTDAQIKEVESGRGWILMIKYRVFKSADDAIATAKAEGFTQNVIQLFG